MKNSIIWISIIVSILLFIPLVIVLYDYLHKEYDCMSVEEIDYQRYQHIVDWSC